MYCEFSEFFIRVILLSTFILQTLGVELHIQQDEDVPGIFVWTSVAVYADDVDTSSFTAQELYGLAQSAFGEMRADQASKAFGGNKRPNVMAALAIGNLIYFASSVKGTHYIYAPSRADTVIAGKLRTCQGALELARGTQMALHKNKAQCGEVLALHLQETDTHPSKPDFAATRKQIVAYGGTRIDNAVPKACCGDTEPGQAVDLTSWGCKQFMESENVGIYPAIAPAAIILPSAEPVSFRRVPLC